MIPIGSSPNLRSHCKPRGRRERRWRGDAHTKPQAHQYIEQHWRELKDGDVIDVEFILGETDVKKTSEAMAQSE
jgi:hypothetical protein